MVVEGPKLRFFLKLFIAALTNPIKIKTMVEAANNHLINVAMDVIQASVSGVEG